MIDQLADVIARQMVKELEDKLTKAERTIAELTANQCTCAKPRPAIFNVKVTA